MLYIFSIVCFTSNVKDILHFYSRCKIRQQKAAPGDSGTENPQGLPFAFIMFYQKNP